MSASHFRVLNHVVPCQHIREYPQGTALSQEDELSLAVKQYIPLSNPDPQPGDVTFIGAHANGFPKELYEPLWDELLARSREEGFKIRGIWIADVANQGDSGVLNEKLLGNDPGWNDVARDLLLFINLKREQIKRPIVGIGHSLGGNALVSLSLMHPRLFTTLILLDPVIMDTTSWSTGGAITVARLSTYRRDHWLSRSAAETSFRKSPFYKSWDPRVLGKWLEYGLRENPTLIYPETPNPENKEEIPITLKTTKHQELFTFQRPNYPPFPYPYHNNTLTTNPLIPSSQSTNPSTFPFSRPECDEIFLRLPSLRPPTLYLFGQTSELSAPDQRAAKMARTGVGVGGSGGVEAGEVKEIVLDGIGHLVPMEAPGKTAEEAGRWIGRIVQRWKIREEEEGRSAWMQKATREKVMVDEKWVEMVGGKDGKGGKGGKGEEKTSSHL